MWRKSFLILSTILIGICKQWVFADHGHQNCWNIERPTSVICNHPYNVINWQSDDRNRCYKCATVSALDLNNSVDNEVSKERHPDVKPIYKKLKRRAQNKRINVTILSRRQLAQVVTKRHRQYDAPNELYLILAEDHLQLWIRSID